MILPTTAAAMAAVPGSNAGTLGGVSSAGTSPDSSPRPEDQHAWLQLSLVQNTQIVQYLIDNAKWLFEGEEAEEKKRSGETRLLFNDK